MGNWDWSLWPCLCLGVTCFLPCCFIFLTNKRRTVLSYFTRSPRHSVMIETVCDAKVWMSLGVICYVLLAKACQLGRGRLVSAKSRFIKKFPNRQASLYLFSRYIELNTVLEQIYIYIYLFFFSSILALFFPRPLDSFDLSAYPSQMFSSPCIFRFWILILSSFCSLFPWGLPSNLPCFVLYCPLNENSCL